MHQIKVLIPKILIFLFQSLLIFASASPLFANPRPVGWALIDTCAPQLRGFKCSYDPHNNQIVLFGGQDTLGQKPDNIWEFSGWGNYHWNQIEAPGPAGRIGHGLCYDTSYQNIFLFGGQDQSGRYLNDTWVWHEQQWIRLDSANNPPPRAYFALIYDLNRRRVVLFGGIGDDTLYGDTWEWNGDNGWHQIATEGPSPRINAGMTFANGPSANCVLYGGQAGPDGEILNDTWIWDGQSWTLAQIDGDAPSLRSGFATGAYENNAAIFGGQDASGSDSLLNDIWVFDQSPNHQYRWYHENYSVNAPPPRSQALMTTYYDWELVIIGGMDESHILRDMWVFPAALPEYVVGDVNCNRIFNGLDVVYAVDYFNGGPPPPFSYDCPPYGVWYVEGDVNASCTFNGLDVTYMVAYLKGGPILRPCPNCPP